MAERCPVDYGKCEAIWDNVRLWNLIDGKRNISDILDSISPKYEGDRKKMKKYLMDFFTQLLSLDAIRLRNEN